LAELAVHIVGTGSVGLTYGHLLASQGHQVSHTSVRGTRLADIPVRQQTAAGTRHATYSPRYYQPEQASPVADVTIYAVPPAICCHYLDRTRTTRQGRRSARSLMLSSFFDANAYEAISWRNVADAFGYPLVSSEYSCERGLTIVSGADIEVLVRPAQRSLAAASLLDDLGLRVAGYVDLRRFRARYIQTAALYVILLAVGRGVIDRARVPVEMISEVFSELIAMSELADGQTLADASIDPSAAFSIFATLISLREPQGTHLLSDNVDYLISQGQRKLVAHLDALRSPWQSYLSVRPAPLTASRALISSVLSQCSPS
jgi:hypothetical protein